MKQVLLVATIVRALDNYGLSFLQFHLLYIQLSFQPTLFSSFIFHNSKHQIIYGREFLLFFWGVLIKVRGKFLNESIERWRWR